MVKIILQLDKSISMEKGFKWVWAREIKSLWKSLVIKKKQTNHPALLNGPAGKLSFSSTAEQFPPVYRSALVADLNVFSITHKISTATTTSITSMFRAVKTNKFFNKISSCKTWCFGKVSVDVFYRKMAWIVGKLFGIVHWTRPEMNSTTTISYSSRKTSKPKWGKKKHKFHFVQKNFKSSYYLSHEHYLYFLCLRSTILE